MRAIVRVSVLLAVCLAATLAAAPGAGAKVECQGSSDCTTITGPWVVVSVPSDPNDYGAMWTGFCPTPQLTVGTDWISTSLSAANHLLVFINQEDGLPLFGFNGTEFIAVNESTKPLSFQPLIGCSPTAAAGTASHEVTARAAQCTPFDPRCGQTHRVAVHALAAGRSYKFVHRCHRGERLVNAGSSVAFLKKNPPSPRELAEVKIRHSERYGARGAETVRITTGRHVGDDEKVQAQVHTFCA